MKTWILTVILLVGTMLNVTSQMKNNTEAFEILSERGELYFSFSISKPISTAHLTKIISIDKVEQGTIWAYANTQSFNNFLALNIPYEIEIAPSMLHDFQLKSIVDIRSITSWDFYPTYNAYLQMMSDYASTYPELCKLVKFGESIEGRDLLVLKLSDNVNVHEAEPEFLYTATMHGDETTGYNLMLHLIDYLLSNYSTNAEVADLLNNTEIWINPLANPDGTYWLGNSSVNGAIRYNANAVDLNRNFPDLQSGLHPDGNPWQLENIAMIDFMNEHDFVMSCNMHTGAEVLNYPWDTMEKLHADDDWYYATSRAYVDTVHANKPSNWASYLTYLDNGITNGYAWYTTDGNRQDYSNYFMYTRETTLELSNIKSPSPNLLPTYWNAHYRSLINYVKECQYGIRGFVSDAESGDPIAAKIELLNHDEDHSYVFAGEEYGDYYRLVHAGVYDVKFSAAGYQDKIVSNVSVVNQQATFLDVELEEGSTSIETSTLTLLSVYPNPAYDVVVIDMDLSEAGSCTLSLTNCLGQIIKQEAIINPGNRIELSVSDCLPGVYSLQLQSADYTASTKLLIR